MGNMLQRQVPVIVARLADSRLSLAEGACKVARRDDARVADLAGDHREPEAALNCAGQRRRERIQRGGLHVRAREGFAHPPEDIFDLRNAL